MGATSLDLSQIKTDVLSAASTFRALIGLGNVNNTADLDKPISTATQGALDLKANSSSLANYLPLAGGTLTGGLSGTTGVFSGSLQAPQLLSGTGNLLIIDGGSGISVRHNGGHQHAFATGSFITRGDNYIGWTNGSDMSLPLGLSMYRDGTDTLGLRRGANANRLNLYGTYTDASNYRRFYVSSTTAGAFTLGVEGLGTGASGNTLNIAGDVTSNGAYRTNSNFGWKFLSAPAYNPTQTTGLYHAGNGYHYWYSEGSVIMRWHPSGITEVPSLSVTGAISGGAGTFSGAFTITQPVSTSGSPTAFTLTGGAHTTLTASTEATDVNFNLARTVQFAAGNITTQRAFRIQAPTYSFASASTITTASTLSISGAPVAGTNATITNRWALNVESGDSYFGGAVRTSDLGPTNGNRVSIANQLWQFSMNGQDDISFTQQGGTDSWGVCVRLGGYSAGALPFGDVKWVRDAANIWGQRVGTNSQTLRIYNTYTDASNYIRQSLSFTTYSSTVHAQLGAEGAGTGAVNIPFVITPRGTGAFILGPMPDGTSTGGNARGANAVDLQTLRSAASQVASGESSFVAGRANTASNFRSVALGFGNSVSQTNGFAAGNSNTVSGGIVENGIALGAFNTASSGSAVAVGYANLASGSRAFATGDSTQSTAFCTSTFGHRSVADRYAMTAFSAGWFSANGDAQKVLFVVRNKTTNTTPTVLFLDGSSTRLTIPSGKMFLFEAKIIGVRSDGLQRASYIRKGTIVNVAGTTSLVGVIEAIGTDVEDNPALDMTITADDANDALAITVTGITGETWRWVAVVEGVEVAYGT